MSIFSSILIWFGAGVSIAEIITGTYFAPLGLARGTAAIIIGHIIGCALFFFTGLIGAKTKKSAMDTTAISFGKVGAKFFALLNVLQLAGWTGIMIYDGSLSAGAIFGRGDLAVKAAALIIGALIIVWILVGLTNLGRVNVVAMAALFGLTVFLCIKLFCKNGAGTMPFGLAGENAEETMSFGAAVELAVAMPLSWLPVISDYTKDAEKPFGATLASTLTYFAVSCWMYFIGMGASVITGEGTIESAMLKTGLGVSALIIIVLSTVTTTFLDAYSAGVSGKTIFAGLNVKIAALVVAAAGSVGAILFNMDDITGFLYLIGSVFAPMTAILLADYFLLRKDDSAYKINIASIVVWIAGFILYRIFMNFDFVCGNTLPVMAITFVIELAVGKICSKKA